MRRVLVLVLLLGLVFTGRSFAGISSFNALGVDSDRASRLGYIAMWEQQDESDLLGGHSPIDGTNWEAREITGWITIHYNHSTTVYELAFMTPGVFHTVAQYNATYLAGGYNGLETFYYKQQVYNPVTGEIYVPIENQSPKSVH